MTVRTGRVGGEVNTTRRPAQSGRSLMGRTTQWLLPLFTVGEFALVSFKLPAWSMLFSLASLPFWFTNSWAMWRDCRRAGALISTAATTVFILFGVANYWLLP